MAGHSKWANIKFKKAAQDAKRGKLFTRLTREIIVAAKNGGPDPSGNPRLRTAIDKALSGNMTRDAIERAVKRATGDNDGKDIEEIRYEGYGPEGVAIMVDCMTDNRNRTVSEVRHAFSKYGGNLGTDGSVSYMFSKIGQIVLPEGTSEEQAFDIGLELGAEEIEVQDDTSVLMQVGWQEITDIKESLESKGFTVASAEEVMKASNEIKLDKEQSEKVMKLMDVLEDLDDVQNVHTNADFDEEYLSSL